MMIIAGLIDLYSLVVFVAIILSWIPSARESAFGPPTVSQPEIPR